MRFLRVLAPWFFFSLSCEVALGDERRAKELFTLCATCHGNQGEGKREIGAPRIAGLPAWYVETQLKKFILGARGAHPKDLPGMRMRPMAKTLRSDADIQDIATLVSNLKPPQSSAKSRIGSWMRGESHYQVCIPCHGQNAEGNQTVGAPPLRGADDWYLVTQLENFRRKSRGYDSTHDALGMAMGAVVSILDEKALKDVAAYASGLE